MTETQWESCTDPTPMLEFLRTTGRLSQRKARLFAAAACRRIWPLLTDERSRRAVEVAERVADGLGSHQELALVCEAAASAWGAAAYAADAAAAVGGDAVVTAMLAADAAAYATDEQTEDERHAEEAEQSRLLREIISNPFRTPPHLTPSWLAWNDRAVRKMAQAIYDGRAFDRMPLLADALEDAGCADAAILAHCRGGGEHVRGCWALDLLLGKE